MAQTITVSCKLQVPTEIQPDVDKTLVKFADACNRILDTALMENEKNTTGVASLGLQAS